MPSTENFSRYFPPSKEFTDCGCQIVSFGFEKVGVGGANSSPEPPSDHLIALQNGRVASTFSIQVITTGSGTFQCGEQPGVPVAVGDVLLLFPEIHHRYRPDPETGWSCWWIEMTGSMVKRWLQSAQFTPDQPVLRDVDTGAIRETIEELFVATADEGVIKPMLLSLLVLQLITRTRYAVDKEPPTQNEIRTARRIIREHTTQAHIDWPAVSQQIGISYSKLRQDFTRAMGVGPAQYHSFLRERLAVSLLRNSSQTITQIATHLGFESNFYFSVFVKRRTGLSPTALRSQGKANAVPPAEEVTGEEAAKS